MHKEVNQVLHKKRTNKEFRLITKIIPIERLVGVLVNIDGVHSVANFEFIEVVDNN